MKYLKKKKSLPKVRKSDIRMRISHFLIRKEGDRTNHNLKYWQKN